MSGRPEILALILARGGSRGIPRKNLMPVAGRPLIAYPICQARASRHITRTVVSTDDAEIADVARAWGAEAPFTRPADIAGDHSTDIEAFRHALRWLREREGYAPDAVVHLRATEPVRRVCVMDAAIEKFLAHPDADSLRTVSPATEIPYKMWHVEGDYMRPVVTLPDLPEAHSVGRQLLPQAYCQDGYVDVIRPRTILELNSMVGRTVVGMVTSEPRHDIDTMADVPATEDALRRMPPDGATALLDQGPVRGGRGEPAARASATKV
jgi:CMP-N,N'-diacetyllegionaminic acid synthase